MTPQQKRLAKLLGIRIGPVKRRRRYRIPVPTEYEMLVPLTMPDKLPDLYRPIWQDIVAHAPAGILAACDSWLVELIAHELEKLKRDTLLATELDNLSRCLSKLLMAPDHRFALVRRYLPMSMKIDLAVVSSGSLPASVN